MRKQILVRLCIVAAALTLWFWTQSLLGQRTAPTDHIVDQIHLATEALNAKIAAHEKLGNIILISSSLVIDCLGIFLLASGIFGPSLRPVVGLISIFILRQLVQATTSLPMPPHIIWHDPGFPSLLVTYGVAGDFFFSGHTAIAVFAATELARLKKKSLMILGVCAAVFEIAVVLLLHAHYTMDVVTGIAVALLVALSLKNLSFPRKRESSQ